MTLRDCIVTFRKWDTTSRQMQPFQTIPAKFHGWGFETDEDSQHRCAISVGIVEFADGEVQTALPMNIKFPGKPAEKGGK